MDHPHHAANDARSMGIGSTQAEIRNPENPRRRRLLRVALGRATLPSVCALLGSVAGAARGARVRPLDARLSPPPAPGAAGSIVRDFTDPYLELVRLLHVAAEIEHALMIQYLYAAFSLKPAYQEIVGSGAPGSDDLLGVAIQEMQHLGKVNQPKPA